MEIFSINGIENVILKVSQTHFSKDFYPKGGGGIHFPRGGGGGGVACLPKGGGGCEVPCHRCSSRRCPCPFDRNLRNKWASFFGLSRIFMLVKIENLIFLITYSIYGKYGCIY